jgi:hypothetical protein
MRCEPTLAFVLCAAFILSILSAGVGASPEAVNWTNTNANPLGTNAVQQD